VKTRPRLDCTFENQNFQVRVRGTSAKHNNVWLFALWTIICDVIDHIWTRFTHAQTPTTDTTVLVSKTRNVHEKGLYSNVLQKWVKFKVSSPALREIDRKGGLDEYILLTDIQELGGVNSAAGAFRDLLLNELEERKRKAGLPSEQDQVKFGQQNEQKPDWKAMLNEPLVK
jgi:hypothetical protein